MKNLFKKPKSMLKALMAGMFVCAMAIGMAISVGVSGSNGNVSLVNLSNVQAQGEINPDCPNGCVAGEGRCYCYKWYPLKPYNWGD